MLIRSLSIIAAKSLEENWSDNRQVAQVPYHDKDYGQVKARSLEK